MYSPGYAGTFGFGLDSAVWKIIGSPAEKKFDIYLAPLADYSYLSWFTPVDNQSEMNFGEWGNYGFNIGQAGYTATPKTDSYLFEMEYFEFGLMN